MDWLAFLMLATVALVRAQETCLSAEPNPYLYFATKTAYNFVNTGAPNSHVHEISGCAPVAFWLLARHGAHLPEISEIHDLQRLTDFQRNILQNYKMGNFRNTNQRICATDLDLLERWTWDPRHNATFAGQLSSEGYMMTQRVAQAWRQRYPDLLTANRHDYIFKYVQDRRSSNSFHAFTEGLFGQAADTLDIPQEHNDQLAKPYESCPVWTRDVKENNETSRQATIFRSKQEFNEMIANISHRLGFSYNVDLATLHRMYQMCRYNKAWDVAQISPWCAVFTKDDLKRLEYAEDLDTYYQQGYGSTINQKVGCTLIKDMVAFFRNKVANPDVPQQPKATIHFTDGPMLLMTLAALGAHRDLAPLTGDNYHAPQTSGRKWTTSTIDPFNANLAAVLYRCHHPTPDQQFKILFLENEHQMQLDDCRVGLCDWPLVQARFGAIADNCDMKFCNSAISLNSYAGLVVSLAAFLMGITGL